MSQTENIKKWLKSPAAHLTAVNARCNPLQAKALCAALSDSILDDPFEVALVSAYRVALAGEQATMSDGEAPRVVLRREDHPYELANSSTAIAEFHFCPMCGAPWEGGLHKAFCFGPPTTRTSETMVCPGPTEHDECCSKCGIHQFIILMADSHKCPFRAILDVHDS